MLENLLISTIPSLITLVGVVITVCAGNDKIRTDMQLHNAVQDEKIETLTREVREHNEIARLMPVHEQRIKAIEKRLEKLEGRE